MTRPRLPPGPAAPFFGVGLARRLCDEPLALATELASRFGELASFPLGPYRAVVVNHPALVREVLITKAKCFRKLPRVMRVVSQLVSGGIVTGLLAGVLITATGPAAQVRPGP